MGLYVFPQHCFFKETTRQEIQTYTLKSSAKWKTLYFFTKKFSAKSLPETNCKWTSQLRTNKSGNPVNGCPVFSCALPRSDCPLGRDRKRTTLQCVCIYRCNSILKFRSWLHSHDNPSFTKPLIISTNGGQTVVQTVRDFIISSFSWKNTCWCLFSKDPEIWILTYFLPWVNSLLFWCKRLENPNY